MAQDKEYFKNYMRNRRENNPKIVSINQIRCHIKKLMKLGLSEKEIERIILNAINEFKEVM